MTRPRIELVKAARQYELHLNKNGQVLHGGVDVLREVERAACDGWLYRTTDHDDHVLWLPTAKGNELLFEDAESAEASGELARQSRAVAEMAMAAVMSGVVGLILAAELAWPRWAFGTIAVGTALAVVVAVAGYRRADR